MGMVIFLLVAARLPDKSKVPLDFSCLESTGEVTREVLCSHVKILEGDIETTSDVDKDMISILEYCAALQLALHLSEGMLKDMREKSVSICNTSGGSSYSWNTAKTYWSE